MTAKISLSKHQLHDALGLAEDVEVYAIHVTSDPDLIHIRINGERFDNLQPKAFYVNFDDVEVPRVPLSEAQ